MGKKGLLESLVMLLVENFIGMGASVGGAVKILLRSEILMSVIIFSNKPP